jgi:hypothetical protein
MSDFEYLLEVAKNIRQWYLEDNPHASAYAYTMTNPTVLKHFLLLVSKRLMRNRTYYMRVQDIEWGRTQAFYNWFHTYLDTTDPEYPDKRHMMTGESKPLLSVQDGMHHMVNKFKEEFAAQDTMHVREEQRLRRWNMMNGQDRDMYYSYTGPTGGPHLRPITTKSVGPDGVWADTQEADTSYKYRLVNTAASLHGQNFRQVEKGRLANMGWS